MLRLDWATPAAAEFERTQSFYQGIDARMATLLARRVHGAIRQLREMPNSGRPGLRPGTRERVVAKSPYVLVYRVRV
jgi:toxin ParE1/3/4